MKCKCKAKPKPEVTWFRGANVVKESSKISIKTKTVEEDVYELILEIKVSDVPSSYRSSFNVIYLIWLYIYNIVCNIRPRIPRHRTVVLIGVTYKTNSAKVTLILI